MKIQVSKGIRWGKSRKVFAHVANPSTDATGLRTLSKRQLPYAHRVPDSWASNDADVFRSSSVDRLARETCVSRPTLRHV